MMKLKFSFPNLKFESLSEETKKERSQDLDYKIYERLIMLNKI